MKRKIQFEPNLHEALCKVMYKIGVQPWWACIYDRLVFKQTRGLNGPEKLVCSYFFAVEKDGSMHRSKGKKHGKRSASEKQNYTQWYPQIQRKKRGVCPKQLRLGIHFSLTTTDLFLLRTVWQCRGVCYSRSCQLGP